MIEFDVTALLQDEAAGSPVLIKSIVPGGSCDRDGVCRVGDTVIAVNDEKVAHLAVIDVREKIVGPMGTTVSVLFQRPTGDYYEVFGCFLEFRGSLG